MTTTIRKIIRTDGTEEPLPVGASMSAIRKAIGAETFFTVPLRHLGLPLHVMLGDDGGYETMTLQRGPGSIELVPLAAKKPVNHAATALYHANCRPGTIHQIVGDVAIVPDNDFFEDMGLEQPPATHSEI